MDDMEKILNKIEKIENSISSIDHTLCLQKSQIEYHIKRSDTLEAKVDDHDRVMLELRGGIKFGKILITIITVMVGIVEIISFLKHL